MYHITYRRITTGIYNTSTGTISETKTDSSIKGVLDAVANHTAMVTVIIVKIVTCVTVLVVCLDLLQMGKNK